MRQGNSFSAANSAQRKPALLCQQHSKRAAKGGALCVSSVVVTDALFSDWRLFGLLALSGAIPM
jgi:hypothetical protein